MMTKTLVATLIAGVVVAASFSLGSASPFAAASNAQKAPQGYHLDGFQGWDNGYRVGYRGCSPINSFKPGACVPGFRVFQPL